MVDQECDDGAIPVTLATLKADGVELIAIRLEAADALSLRAACSSLREAIGETTWNGIADRVECRRAALAAKLHVQLTWTTAGTVAARVEPDSVLLDVPKTAAAASEKHEPPEEPADDEPLPRERAAFRRLCGVLAHECRLVVSGCLQRVEGDGTASVTELYSSVMPVALVPDADAAAAFLSLASELESLRTTAWWSAFAEAERAANGHFSVADHLDRIVPPCGMR